MPERLQPIEKKLEQTNPEVSRKVLHVTHGIVVAVLAFFVSYWAIVGLEIIFFITVGLARRYDLLGHLRTVNRKSWGEFLYPVGVIAAALLHPAPLIFAIAMLHLGVGDAVAALVGTSVKQPHCYRVFGQQKSVEGSAAFWLTSLIIMLAVVGLAPSAGDFPRALVIVLPFVATFAENLGVYGFDNLSIPVVVVAALSL